MKYLATQDHMDLGISKCYSPYSFHLMSGHYFMKTLGYYGGIQAITFVANRKNFVALLKF